jgi:hypothetical protein
LSSGISSSIAYSRLLTVNMNTINTTFMPSVLYLYKSRCFNSTLILGMIN